LRGLDALARLARMSGSDSGSDTLGRRRRIDALLDVRIWWPHPPLARWIERWRACGRDRRTLAGLDDHALRDLGLDRADVETESTHSFWRQR
jgi:uncharacterized protein YjiS (DUF1127 family)